MGGCVCPERNSNYILLSLALLWRGYIFNVSSLNYKTHVLFLTSLTLEFFFQSWVLMSGQGW